MSTPNREVHMRECPSKSVNFWPKYFDGIVLIKAAKKLVRRSMLREVVMDILKFPAFFMSRKMLEANRTNTVIPVI
jgi:hypothetical protein